MSVPTMSNAWSDAELGLRARRYRQLRAAWLADPERRDLPRLLQERDAAVGGLRELMGRFLAGAAPLRQLREFLDPWAPEHLLLGFVGPVGIDVLDRFADDGEPGEVDDALRVALSLPTDLEDALAKLDGLATYVETLRSEGSSLEARRLPYFVSWFWMVQDGSWRPIWPSGEAVYSKLAWLPSRSAPVATRYRTYTALRASIAERCGAVSPAPGEIEFDEVGGWLHYAERAVGMDETLPERCARARTLPHEPGSDPTEDAAYREALTNARVVQAEVDRLGRVLTDVVAAGLGTDVELRRPTDLGVTHDTSLRTDAWVAWRVAGVAGTAPSIRLRATTEGLVVALDRGDGTDAQTPDVVGAHLDAGRAGAFDTLVADVMDVVATLKPAFDAYLQR
ncbi:MAG TPA: hypothetical protein VFI47_15990 [Acidimicrobiales bacterium]|nr:hypothetical protein [Acidimicrobiales bacterium]